MYIASLRRLFAWSTASRTALASAAKVENREGSLSRRNCRKEADTKSRHGTSASGNVFIDLGFAPKEAKRLLAHADTQIDESIRLKQQLMDEIDEWMKDASVTQAAAAEVRKVEKFTIERRTLFSFFGTVAKLCRNVLRHLPSIIGLGFMSMRCGSGIATSLGSACFPAALLAGTALGATNTPVIKRRGTETGGTRRFGARRRSVCCDVPCRLST